jgi:hypothetical protein
MDRAATGLAEPGLAVARVGAADARGAQVFRLVGRASAGGPVVRSARHGWSAGQVARLEDLVDRGGVVMPCGRLSAHKLDRTLAEARGLLGHGNAQRGPEATAAARRAARGGWSGGLPRDELLAAGFVLRRGAVRRAVAETLCAAARRGFRRRGARGGGASGGALPGTHVHADVPGVGAAGMRSLRQGEAALCPHEEEAWARASASIALAAGKPPEDAADEALMLSYPGQVPQAWHQDSAAGLGYVLALSDGVLATEFMPLPRGHAARVDTMAVGAERRRAFHAAAWAGAADGDADGPREATSAGALRAGDVVFFYTHAIHRAPPPPRRGARYTLFGTYGLEGRSEGGPITRETQEAVWADYDAQ